MSKSHQKRENEKHVKIWMDSYRAISEMTGFSLEEVARHKNFCFVIDRESKYFGRVARDLYCKRDGKSTVVQFRRGGKRVAFEHEPYNSKKVLRGYLNLPLLLEEREKMLKSGRQIEFFINQ
ncbi:MAG: hypothetical protein PHH00_04435 [Candidatus Nanoarchaeia archaeon]|nr:hypothetical protein [Candidatus Nanoarchaeia archaeon]